MAKVRPWSSVNSRVHHNDSVCPSGNRIDFRYRLGGTDWKPLCAECAKVR